MSYATIILSLYEAETYSIKIIIVQFLYNIYYKMASNFFNINNVKNNEINRTQIINWCYIKIILLLFLSNTFQLHAMTIFCIHQLFIFVFK